jgi:hypothetical protein
MQGDQSVLADGRRVVLGHNITEKLHLETTGWGLANIDVHEDYRACGTAVGTHSG